MAALDVQTNYPNVLSIKMLIGENRSHGGETLHLQVISCLPFKK